MTEIIVIVAMNFVTAACLFYVGLTIGREMGQEDRDKVKDEPYKKHPVFFRQGDMLYDNGTWYDIAERKEPWH